MKRHGVTQPGTHYPFSHAWKTVTFRIGRVFVCFGWYRRIPRRQSPESLDWSDE